MKLFIGSCAEDSVGVGYLLIGTEVHSEGIGMYELLVGDKMVLCWDIMVIEDGSTVRSPMESDMGGPVEE